MRKYEEEYRLVEPETAVEEEDAEDADEENEGAAGHLVDGDWGIEKAYIHELSGENEKVRNRMISKRSKVRCSLERSGEMIR